MPLVQPDRKTSARHLRASSSFALLLWAIGLLAGCATTPQSDKLLTAPDATVKPKHELTTVPFFPQQKYQCGPAALATMLADTGLDVTPEHLVDKVYIPARKGSLQVEMLAAARRYHRIPYVLETELSTVLREVSSGKPVLVLQNLGLDWIPRWHYAVVVGYNLAKRQIILRSGELEQRVTPLQVFESTWRRGDYWAVILLKPGELPTSADHQQYFLAVSDYTGHGKDNQVRDALVAGLERWSDSQHLTMALANHYHQTDELNRAISTYEKLLEQHPDYAPAHNNLAMALLELGKQQQAYQHALRAVALGGRFQNDYQNTLQTIEQSMTNRAN